MRMRYKEDGSTVDAARIEGLVFENVPHKVLLPGGHDNQALTMKDVDGTLTGTAGNLLIGNHTPILAQAGVTSLVTPRKLHEKVRRTEIIIKKI